MATNPRMANHSTTWSWTEGTVLLRTGNDNEILAAHYQSSSQSTKQLGRNIEWLTLWTNHLRVEQLQKKANKQNKGRERIWKKYIGLISGVFWAKEFKSERIRQWTAYWPSSAALAAVSFTTSVNHVLDITWRLSCESFRNSPLLLIIN